MFKQIAEMLEPGSALVLTVAKEADGRLCVQVRPVGEFKNGALGQGITFTDTAEVIDAEIVGALQSYNAAHKSLKEQVEDRVRVMAAAAEAEKEAKQAAIKKAATPKTAGKAGGGATALAPTKKPATAASAAGADADGDGGEADAEAGTEAGNELTLF